MTTPSAPDDLRTGNASVIFTCYGPRAAGSEERLEAATLRLAAGLGLQAGSRPDSWQDLTPAHEAFLQRFDPAAAADTTVLQVALNEPGTAGGAWDALRRKLEAAVDESFFRPLWGYSLVYQAELLDGGPGMPEPQAGDPLLQAARRLGAPASEAAGARPLAVTGLPEGAIWLLDTPRHDGAGAVTVYMALNNPGTDNRLLARHLYGPDARLLMPDLIAHKGYYQARQYQAGEFREQYGRRLDAMRAATHVLLHELGRRRERAARLEALARDYSRLVDTLATLERLRVALARQLHNYGWWQREGADDAVLAHHHAFLETASVEIRLLIEEGQGALQAAGTAVEMVRARLEGERQRQQEWLSTLLAVLAVALALPAILDREVLGAISAGLGLPIAASPAGVVWLFGVQAAVVVLVMVLAGLAVHLARRRK